MGEEDKVESNQFWADASMVVAAPVAIAAGLAKGVYDASTDNGAFSDGFSGTATPIVRAARDFGAEHGTTITRGVITGAATAVGARVVGGVLRHIRL
jgi:hypothetical protein